MNSIKPSIASNLSQAVRALKDGKIILLLDDSQRENEGDLVVAAEKITPEKMNFLIKEGSGVVCLALPKARLDELDLPMMIPHNTNSFKTAFTVSIEATFGITTGVSANDRTRTVLTAMDESCKRSDLARPGHVFPLASRPQGVFDRLGHTEGSVDLMRIAGLKAGAVICELMNKDGSMTVGRDRIRFAKEHNIPVVTIEEILAYRLQAEKAFCERSRIVGSRFKDMCWHTFTFYGDQLIDIFFKKDSEWKKPVRLSLFADNNLRNRFICQALEQSQDDPLIMALNELNEEKVDLAIMLSEGCPGARANSDLSLRLEAATCCALGHLGVKKLLSAGLNERFARLAHSYFNIDVIF